jgi:hypothetical protein
VKDTIIGLLPYDKFIEIQNKILKNNQVRKRVRIKITYADADNV